jgi:hypothetical protein
MILLCLNRNEPTRCPLKPVAQQVEAIAAELFEVTRPRLPTRHATSPLSFRPWSSAR